VKIFQRPCSGWRADTGSRPSITTARGGGGSLLPGLSWPSSNRLGCPIEREEDADRFIENRSQEEGLLVPAAAVTLDERPVVLPLRAGRLHRGDRIRMELRTEEGERIAREWKLDDLARDEANRGILPVASSLPYRVSPGPGGGGRPYPGLR